ncbi:MAG: QueT transporter family protein [Clostridiales bacterium]|nr:QueT transporter family protein [Clostridiales bacterium]
MRARFVAHSALIAALYAALTIGLAPISFGEQQFRIAEALCVLPAFTPAAIPGLFVGCLISNTLSFMGLPDMIFGSLATLAAALLARRISKAGTGGHGLLRIALVPLPAVLVNAVAIGAMLAIFLSIPFGAAALGVAIGQAGACYGLGVPLYLLMANLERRNILALDK